MIRTPLLALILTTLPLSASAESVPQASARTGIAANATRPDREACAYLPRGAKDDTRSHDGVWVRCGGGALSPAHRLCAPPCDLARAPKFESKLGSCVDARDASKIVLRSAVGEEVNGRADGVLADHCSFKPIRAHVSCKGSNRQEFRYCPDAPSRDRDDLYDEPLCVELTGDQPALFKPAVRVDGKWERKLAHKDCALINRVVLEGPDGTQPR